MLKKIIYILGWILMSGYLIASFLFVSEKQKSLACTGIKVKVMDSVTSGFVSNLEVEKIIKNKYPKWKGDSINGINKEVLENIINKIPFVKKSEVYNSLSGNLVVEICQRKPILRILQAKGYYIDSEGEKLPLSPKFTARVLVASGAINDSSIKEELFGLAKYITNDEFWNSQITQIHVRNNHEYILIPRVGDHKIEFGKMENYQKKFQKLYALYTYGFAKKGWNNYDKINLRYENQVVCTKK